ncbi:hypothetical protein CDL12_26842 [Handroanthus impetiginosus]|uniref:Membrane-associated kinase regulator 6 n=1 Tax=Handroanthus impetiginosus TaxID=429701 RepID=A0A2G9G5R4_9LAMI|nr:hypothetical protein CDL12_26842 [Handroanthus impetiginosus]
MENSHSLATESFSYSWLTDKKQHYSDQNSSEKEQNFHFDVPFTASPIALVHADEIFSDGHIMPIYVNRSKAETLKTSTYSVPQSPIYSSYSLESPFVAKKKVGKWRKSSKRILKKCFGFVKPLSQTIGFSRKSTRVDDLERKVFEVKTWSNSLEASPRTSLEVKKKVDYGLKKVKSWSSSPRASPVKSPSCSSNSRGDLESSIHEAILYCKRSIEK